jgi:hypothetical protein
VIIYRTDADPVIISNYVISLLKYDKPIPDLKSSVSTSLKDFLNSGTNIISSLILDTESFVSSLFEFLSPSNKDEDQIIRKEEEEEENEELHFRRKRKFQNDTEVEESGFTSQYAPSKFEHPHPDSDSIHYQGYRPRFPRPYRPDFRPSYRVNYRAEYRPEYRPELRPGFRKVIRNDPSKPVCSEFREKGYCLKGDECKMLHKVLSSTLTVDKIPEESCTVEAVQEYFSRYGTILAVDVDTTLKKATVEFENAEDATKAYSSPEPVFDNRFVRVYFQQPEKPKFASPRPKFTARPHDIRNKPYRPVPVDKSQYRLVNTSPGKDFVKA